MGLWAWLNLEPSDVLALAVCNLIGFAVGLLVPDPSVRVYVSILLSYHLFLVWLANSGDYKFGFSMPLPATIFTHLACCFLIVVLAVSRQHVPFFGIFRYAIVAMAVFERKWLFSVSRYAPAYTGPVDLLKSPMERGVYQPPVSLLTMQPTSVAGALQPPAAAAQAAPAATLSIAPEANAVPKYEPPKYEPIVQLQPQQPAAAPPQRIGGMKVDTSIADTFRRQPEPGGDNVAPILNATAQDHDDWLRERAGQNPTHRKPGMSVRDEYEQWLKERFRNRAAQGSGKANASVS